MLTHRRPVSLSQWSGVNLPTPPRLQTFSATDACPPCTFSSILPFIIVLNASRQRSRFNLPHQSAHLRVGQMGPSDFHWKAKFSIYFSAILPFVSVSCNNVKFTLLTTVCNPQLLHELWHVCFPFPFSGHEARLRICVNPNWPLLASVAILVM